MVLARRPGRRARAARAALVPLAALAVAAGGCSSGNAEAKARAAAQGFLDAWAKGDVATAAKGTDDPRAATAYLTGTRRALGPGAATLRVRRVIRGKTTVVGFRASWTLAGAPQPWAYDGRLAMTDKPGHWTVHWQPSDVHPRLASGQRLHLDRVLPARAPILDDHSQPLARAVQAVVVGIEPNLVKDLPTLAAALARVLRVDAGQVTQDVQAAKPTEFVPVITLPQDRYLALKPQIYNLPGTVFRTSTTVVTPAPHFAQPLLGTVGPASADLLKQVGPAYLGTDQLGVSGLQRAFDAQLAGTPTVRVTVVDARGATAGTVGLLAGRPGVPLRTTLDQAVQRAAERALARVSQRSAIVAVQPSTGAIRAVATSAGVFYDIALLGRYPPGSTFKIVTASAVLENGVAQPSTPVACPSTVTISGRTIPNENRFTYGTIPFVDAFAHSCNTTFAALSVRLPNQALPQTAAQYGIGAGWDLGPGAFSGSLPTPSSPLEKAADGFGQGKVVVSPLAEALMAATVAHGSTPVPMIVEGRPAKVARPPAAPPAAVVATLRTFMRAVVTRGTATELDGAPGGPVFGKTGTAEHGTTQPMPAHSWFTGYQGDLAFSVFVEDGQTTGQPANPLALRFLTALNA